MHYQSTRTLARRGHIAIAVFQFAYIYTPLHLWHYGLAVVQWVTFPLLVLSGVWLHSGSRIWRWLHPGRARQRPTTLPHDSRQPQQAA
jgi:hypothetical protein